MGLFEYHGEHRRVASLIYRHILKLPVAWVSVGRDRQSQEAELTQAERVPFPLFAAVMIAPPPVQSESGEALDQGINPASNHRSISSHNAASRGNKCLEQITPDGKPFPLPPAFH